MRFARGTPMWWGWSGPRCSLVRPRGRAQPTPVSTRRQSPHGHPQVGSCVCRRGYALWAPCVPGWRLPGDARPVRPVLSSGACWRALAMAAASCSCSHETGPWVAFRWGAGGAARLRCRGPCPCKLGMIFRPAPGLGSYSTDPFLRIRRFGSCNSDPPLLVEGCGRSSIAGQWAQKNGPPAGTRKPVS